MSENNNIWIRPGQYMKIQRKKLSKLRERIETDPAKEFKEPNPASANGVVTEKRSNPFVKISDQDVKRIRTIHVPIKPIKPDQSIFDQIHNKGTKAAPNLEAPLVESPRRFAKSQNSSIGFIDDDDEHESDSEPSKPTKTLPIDWCLKSRVRILSKTQIVSSTLKSMQESSALTGFVRCMDIKSSGLDESDESRFHQNLMYWQYPHLPWLNLVQRNASSNNQFKMKTPESDMLLKDWMECFKNLFQQLRAGQCSFFYVLGNQFTVLFRAAGIGGIGEMHAFLTPTTRGFRQLLKDEDIEYTQPLKKSSKDEATPNTSYEQSDLKNQEVEEDDDEDEDELKFLESLGVQTSDIKFKEDIIARKKEIEDDNGDLSTALIEGADCQAFFNFLLNAKSTVPKVGRLAGIPPTLLSPVAFLGSSLRKQTMRASKIRLENEDFCSIEVRGAILPNTIHTICNFLSEIKENYSLTMSNYVHTVALTKASRKVIEDLADLQATQEPRAEIKLSNCGIDQQVLDRMCQLEENSVNIIERIQFDAKNGGYTLF